MTGIWKHREIRKIVGTEHLISLNEGNTPVLELKINKSKAVQTTGKKVFIKDENKNPTGSWKDRGTAYKVTRLLSQGTNEVVMSSSGNAAISLLTYANKVNRLKVHVVVKPNTSNSKKELLQKLLNNKHEIHFNAKAKREASRIAAKLNIQLLRSSTDEDFVKGYWSLGFELYKLIKNEPKKYIILCTVSSGATFVGLAQGLLMKLEDSNKMPKLVALQTQYCHPIINQMYPENNEVNATDSLVEAVANKTVLRSPQIIKAIRETNGIALSITDKELRESKAFAESKNLPNFSWTSLMPIAGYLRLINEYKDFNFICITSGR